MRFDTQSRKLHVYSDSEVVVRQMNGEYICRSPRLYSLHWICRKLAHSFDFSISHVRREHNTEANRLANSAVRKNLSRPSSIHQISLLDTEQILPSGRSRRTICDLQLQTSVSMGMGTSYLMVPVPDRISFIIPQHQRVRALHDFPCEDQIRSAVLHLRSRENTPAPNAATFCAA